MYDAEGIVSEIQANERAREFKGRTGYSDNFRDSIGIMIDEDLSISSQMDPRRELHNPFTDPTEFFKALTSSHRTRKIAQMQKLISEGKIDQSMKDRYTERKARYGTITDWEGLAVEANETLDAENRIETQADFEKIRNEELAHRRSVAEDTRSRASGMGTLGAFAGSATAGAGLEPIAIVTAPLAIPLTGAKELSKVVYAVHVARNAAILNVGLQGVIEPFVHNWKEEIGAEYTWLDSVVNLTAAGVLGGTVAGSGTYIGGLIGSSLGSKEAGFVLSKDRATLFDGFKKYGFEEEEARVLSDEMYEINNAPDKEASSEEFTAEREVRQEEMNREDLPADPEPDEMFDATQATPIKEEVDPEMKKLGEEADAEAIDPLDALIDELPDDLTFRVDGRAVKAKNLHKPIDKDLREVKRIQECLIGG